MTIQKSGERTAAKVICIILQALAATVAIGSIAFFIVYAILVARPYGLAAAWRRFYIGMGCGFLIGGIAWSVLNAFTLKTLYTSNSYCKMMTFGIVNAIFIITFLLTVLMIIIAIMECRGNKSQNKK